MKFTKYDSPINDRELKTLKDEDGWISAYLSNRDFRTITYDEIVSSSTKASLIDRIIETREKFEQRLALATEHFKTNPETKWPIKYILWKVELDIKNQKFLFICAIDENNLNEKDTDSVLRFRRLTLLKFEEKWKFSGISTLQSEGLASFPWNDDSKIEQIMNQKCAKYQDQVIEACGSSK